MMISNTETSMPMTTLNYFKQRKLIKTNKQEKMSTETIPSPPPKKHQHQHQQELFANIFKLFGRKNKSSTTQQNVVKSETMTSLPTPLKQSAPINYSQIKSTSLTSRHVQAPISKYFKSFQITLDRGINCISESNSSYNNSVSFGFTLTGYCPCQIAKVDRDSIAERAGLLSGDLVIKINEKNVSRATCESIVKIIKNLIAINNRSINLEVLRNTSKKSQKSTSYQCVSASASTTSSLAVLPVNIVNSTEYSDLNLKVKANPITPKLINKHKKKLNKKRKHKKNLGLIQLKAINDYSTIQNESITNNSSTNSSSNSMPSPIPYMSPLNVNKIEDNNPLVKTRNKKATSITDSDYKTQSSGVTDNDVHSLDCNDQISPNTKQDDTDNDLDEAHLIACEQILNLEEKFIELMQKGVQHFSRPLRHCMMISTIQHHDMFQNIEKILAISEYQLNQLISQDDSTLLGMFNTIGKLYENKMRMSCEAFDIYLNGIKKSFDLLSSLMKSNSIAPNFAKFLDESQEDIEMDLKSFLLLPLYYVGEIYSSLESIRENTLPNTNDYVCLSMLMSNLENYVNKSTLILEEYNNGQSKNPLRALNAFMNENEDDFIAEEEKESKLLYASSSIQYRQSSHKWKKIQILLLSDKIILLSRRTNVKDFLKTKVCTSEFQKSQYKSICLKNISNINFSLTNQFEFQLNYFKLNNMNSMHSVRLKVNSIEEKLKWNKIFSKCLKSRN